MCVPLLTPLVSGCVEIQAAGTAPASSSAGVKIAVAGEAVFVCEAEIVCNPFGPYAAQLGIIPVCAR